MDKRSKIMVVIFAIVLVLLLVSEAARPKPLNWRKTFSTVDKIPYGTYVFSEELPEVTGQEVEHVKLPPIEYMLFQMDTLETGNNYVFLNSYLYLDNAETKKLYQYAARGNKVFLSANNINTSWKDTFNLATSRYYSMDEDSVKIRLVNPAFKSTYYFTKGLEQSYFTSYDTINSTVLGYLDRTIPDSFLEDLDGTNTKQPEVNFVETKVGKGAFYFHTLPEAYTNYYMLGDNADYAFNTMAYLNPGKTYVDNYYRSGRKRIESPIQFLLLNEPLRWAYYTALILLILYLIFRGKREQKVIPVVEPLKNSTVAFTRTIGSMYYNRKDYSNVIRKRITYFLQHVRSKYHLDTSELNERFIERLSVKSAFAKAETSDLIALIIHLKNKPLHTEADLVELNDRLEEFLNR